MQKFLWRLNLHFKSVSVSVSVALSSVRVISSATKATIVWKISQQVAKITTNTSVFSVFSFDCQCVLWIFNTTIFFCRLQFIVSGAYRSIDVQKITKKSREMEKSGEQFKRKWRILAKFSKRSAMTHWLLATNDGQVKLRQMGKGGGGGRRWIWRRWRMIWRRKRNGMKGEEIQNQIWCG